MTIEWDSRITDGPAARRWPAAPRRAVRGVRPDLQLHDGAVQRAPVQATASSTSWAMIRSPGTFPGRGRRPSARRRPSSGCCRRCSGRRRDRAAGRRRRGRGRGHPVLVDGEAAGVDPVGASTAAADGDGASTRSACGSASRGSSVPCRGGPPSTSQAQSPAATTRQQGRWLPVDEELASAPPTRSRASYDRGAPDALAASTRPDAERLQRCRCTTSAGCSARCCERRRRRPGCRSCARRPSPISSRGCRQPVHGQAAVVAARSTCRVVVAWLSRQPAYTGASWPRSSSPVGEPLGLRVPPLTKFGGSGPRPG